MRGLGIKALIILILILAIKTGSASAGIYSCTICHSNINSQYSKSVHSEIGTTCTECHGGDPSDLTFSAMSRAKGYKGKISRASIPLLCAKCHSDVKMMLQYREYVDEYAIYRDSEHGKKLRQGDYKVAVCTDCHNTHDIKKASDPNSPAYKLNVPKTCARCHSDKKYMEQYKIPTNQFEKYKESVHGRHVLEQGDMRAPACPDCHGTHGATPPGVKDIHNVCGRCHSVQRENLLRSPHFEAMKNKKIKECAVCHGSHGVQEATIALFTSEKAENGGKGCLGCHKASSVEYGVALELVKTIKEADDAVNIATRLTQKAREKGFDTDEEMNKINIAKTILLEIGPVTHSLSPDIVKENAENVIINAVDVQDMVKAKLVEWRDRRVTLVINILVFLIVIVLLAVKRRRMMKNGSKDMDKQ